MGETVHFSANGREVDGYLACPDAPGPGVIVIQEWWGLVPHITQIADRFARDGFVALAPDLYHGQTTRSPDEAGKMMMALRIDEAEQDLRGAIRYLLERREVTGGTVGTVGFCMGGALSLFAATKNPEVGACVVFYGGHPNVKPDLPNLRAPLLGLYGERDDFVTPAAVRALDGQLEALGKRHEMHVYPGAQHAFFNDERPEVYDEAAASDAWRRTVTFFRHELESL